MEFVAFVKAFGWILALAVVVTAATAFLVLGVLYLIINSAFLPVEQKTGRVLGKRKDEGGAEMYVSADNPCISVIPDAYYLLLDIGGEKKTTAVSQEIFEAVAEGGTVAVSVSRTRYSRRLRIRNVSPLLYAPISNRIENGSV